METRSNFVKQNREPGQTGVEKYDLCLLENVKLGQRKLQNLRQTEQ